jgi:hypothetical protein
MQRDFLLTAERQKVSIATVFFCALFSVSMAFSPMPEVSAATFNLSDPQQRKAFVDAIKERRRPGIERAKEYLRRTDRPKKWTDGVNVFELMAIENGQFIVYTTANANSAISIAADVVRDDPYYWIAGEGITVGVWDEGIALPAHQELIGRVESKDGATYISYHSTHVSGTIAATGIDPNATGMAPLSEVDNYDWYDDTAEMADAAMSTSGEPDKIQISNHSYVNVCGWVYSYASSRWEWYGNPDNRESELFGQYNSAAHSFDEISYNAPYFLPVRGAGNDRGDGTPSEGGTYYYWNGFNWVSDTFYAATGPYIDNWDDGGFDTMTSGACAKNVLTIGAVNDAVTNGNRDISEATMYYKSSWGPTDDGRVKPDLVTNGVSVWSCDKDSDNDYRWLSGTSMSAPAAAGAAVQLIDLYHQLFSGQDMRSSTLKALMIHTADDLGNSGPDYKFGWGLINNVKSAEKLVLHKRNPSANNIIVDSLTQDNNPKQRDMYDDFTFEWDGISPIKVTLCWTDPPGTTTNELDSRTPRLVHDLDITITAPNETKYYEYVLDWLNPNTPATTGDNDRDNVKQVLIDSPVQQGTYTIRVDYDQLSGAQDYSLIISGQAQPKIQDLDGDGNIGLGDLVYLCGNWLTGDVVSDIYPAVGDDWVDLLDFSLLADKWLNP